MHKGSVDISDWIYKLGRLVTLANKSRLTVTSDQQRFRELIKGCDILSAFSFDGASAATKISDQRIEACRTILEDPICKENKVWIPWVETELLEVRARILTSLEPLEEAFSNHQAMIESFNGEIESIMGEYDGFEVGSSADNAEWHILKEEEERTSKITKQTAIRQWRERRHLLEKEKENLSAAQRLRIMHKIKEQRQTQIEVRARIQEYKAQKAENELAEKVNSERIERQAKALRRKQYKENGLAERISAGNQSFLRKRRLFPEITNRVPQVKPKDDFQRNPLLLRIKQMNTVN